MSVFGVKKKQQKVISLFEWISSIYISWMKRDFMLIKLIFYLWYFLCCFSSFLFLFRLHSSWMRLEDRNRFLKLYCKWNYLYYYLPYSSLRSYLNLNECKVTLAHQNHNNIVIKLQMLRHSIRYCTLFFVFN